MNIKKLKAKKRVKVTDLQSSFGILSQPEYLKNRKTDARGTLLRPVTNHENCWWVRHDDCSYAPYWFHELSEDTEPPPPPFGSGKPFGD